MFKSLFANDSLRVVAKAKKTETRGRKTLSKRQKVLNLLSKGESVTWKTLRNRFDLVLNIFAKDAYFKSKINIFGGNQWRPNIHVDDVASGIIKVLEAPLNKVERQIFNLSNSKENLRIKDLALKVGKFFNKCKILISKVILWTTTKSLVYNFSVVILLFVHPYLGAVRAIPWNGG